MSVLNGLDVLLEEPEDYLGKYQIGLVTNPTGVTVELEQNIDALWRNPKIKLKVVFGPEHGARGDIQDALPVDQHVDEKTGLPVYSLYGELVKPTSQMLDGLDTLVFDIQDCGARFYTYVSTLTYCMEACREEGLKMIVLDRPNPINGRDIEGNILEEGFESFIGLHKIPVRHGLTIGEMAQLINGNIQCDLDIVNMRNWERWMWFDDTGLPWVLPSPNLPHLDTATVYPGTCFFEGLNISEGRGTTRPFELIGSPNMDGRKWAKALNRMGIQGVRFRSCFFTPTFWRYEERRCEGVQVHVTDRDSFESVKTGLHMISTAIEIYPDFEFNEPTYDRRRHFDLLAGSDKLREDLQQGKPVEKIIDEWYTPLKRFEKKRERYLIYGDLRN
ncbi:DUF1343 domain-containing protein [Candidatus Bathyarchaeota archaeon]|nr:DUF1343 domain-containing protein [Candidatus Bathyarchaeota archaeon]